MNSLQDASSKQWASPQAVELPIWCQSTAERPSQKKPGIAMEYCVALAVIAIPAAAAFHIRMHEANIRRHDRDGMIKTILCHFSSRLTGWQISTVQKSSNETEDCHLMLIPQGCHLDFREAKSQIYVVDGWNCRLQEQRSWFYIILTYDCCS